MIFKIITISICISIAIYFAIKLYRGKIKRMYGVIAVLFWSFTALIIAIGEIKIILTKWLKVENASDIFVHSAIILYAFIFVKLIDKLSNIDRNIKILAQEIALLKAIIDNKHRNDENDEINK